MNKPLAFKVLKDAALSPEAKAGTTVYSIKGWDYGLASDDTRMTGVEHVSVTLKPDGDYPSFTIPRSHLEKIAEPAREVFDAAAYDQA